MTVLSRLLRWRVGKRFEGASVTETVMAGETLQIDAFAMTIDDVQTADLDQLYALSISVGWPHRAEDWQFLREVGNGVAATDEIGRIMSSAMWFRQAPDLATIGMVITSPRLQTQGAGLWLMEHALKDLEGANLRLNATRAAQRLYLSLGFRPEKTVFQCQGVITHAPEPAAGEADGTLRVLGADDHAAVIALDAAAFGVARAPILEKLLRGSRGYGVFGDGELKAFALCRRFGRGHSVGPIVASGDEDAIRVLAPHIRDHEGQFLRVDTHFEAGDFANLILHSGMAVFDTVLTMSLGKSMDDFGLNRAGAPCTYALVSQTLG